ncbi:unnamed protein product [Rangifer tarandus platyrhynchus]|uniref:Uncharacterized protein n=1 Tax=Rangifer tarandus platyrhynchus TaxID=3082113 RepID=A0ABN9A4A6_RANTA|nr:unnamed protein product [Rangifer tarandus platyrhynchus]
MVVLIKFKFYLIKKFKYSRASPVAQTVKHLPAAQETPVRSLGREDSLESEMATHSSILDWRIPWTVEPGGLQSMGSQSRTHLGDSHTLGELPWLYLMLSH